MTLKQLAKTLNVPVGNLIKKANQNGLKIGSNAPLTESQIELLKATDNTPQLKPVQAPEPIGEMEIREDSAPAAPPQNQSIASIKQQQLSQAIQAENEQFNHQAQTRLQQSFADGQELGVLEVLAREQGRLNASLAVSQVIFESDMKRREAALANLAEKLEGEDFFGEQQSPAESYWKSSQTGASSNWELNQIMQNLAAS
ncbi:hypothetical protein [Kamptonema sp. UHCC 0994]|uniref:hypothetical protein n=1 Tax=Kamptonema sp. UHCC 0994 TaxID=3031329 RepID=UPI0023BB0B15|nr:hypothetical protein [Kamptonema sp. UHCC 0994]MDF0556572.1 hypothetical protein [Kamptonema sp. UHCC 0994]